MRIDEVLAGLFDHPPSELGALLDHLDVGLAVIGAKSQRYLRINAAAARILGRPTTELVGVRWERLVPEEDLDSLHRAAAEQVAGALADPLRLVVRFVRPDGSLVHVLTTTGTVARGSGQDEPFFVCQLLDVTDREQASYHLGLVLDHSPVSLLLLDPSGQVLFSGGGIADDVVGRVDTGRGLTMFDAFPEEGAAHAMLRDAIGGTPRSQVVAALGRYFDLHLMPISDRGGSVSSVAAVATDVTAREHAEAEARARSAEQVVVTDIAQQALDTLDPDVLWRRAVTELAGQLDATVTMHEIDPDADDVAPRLVAAVGPEPPSIVTESVPFDTYEGYQWHAYEAAGWLTMSVPVGRPGAPAAVVAVHRREPLSDHEVDFVRAVGSVLGSAAVRFAMEREIRYRSLHDDLTGLPNRVALLDQLARSLERSRRNHGRTGVVFVDLDGFKNVNDTLGHLAGDELLREVADRLRSSVRPDDVVARLAGDEFAVLCEHVQSHPEVERVAQRVVAALAEPFTLGNRKVTVTASAGVALSGAELADADRLLNASDFAMYAAKRAGAGRWFVHQPSKYRNACPPRGQREPGTDRGG